jgi:hypothetical protein
MVNDVDEDINTEGEREWLEVIGVAFVVLCLGLVLYLHLTGGNVKLAILIASSGVSRVIYLLSTLPPHAPNAGAVWVKD